MKRPLLYGCRDQPLFTVVKPLGSGWTKSASLVKHNITGAVAVAKTVNRRGHIGMVDAEGAARLLLLEALFLEQLASPYVVELLGLCSRGEAHGLTVWVEYMDVGMLGSDEISALASWQERIHWARQAMLLMRFLESSPIGPVLVMDFKSSQFLASSAGLLKASDLDTIRILQPHETRGLNHAKPCRTDGDCTTYAFRSPEFKCTANQTCAGYSSLSNMYVPLFFCISRFLILIVVSLSSKKGIMLVDFGSSHCLVSSSTSDQPSTHSTHLKDLSFLLLLLLLLLRYPQLFRDHLPFPKNKSAACKNSSRDVTRQNCQLQKLSNCCSLWKVQNEQLSLHFFLSFV